MTRIEFLILLLSGIWTFGGMLQLAILGDVSKYLNFSYMAANLVLLFEYCDVYYIPYDERYPPKKSVVPSSVRLTTEARTAIAPAQPTSEPAHPVVTLPSRPPNPPPAIVPPLITRKAVPASPPSPAPEPPSPQIVSIASPTSPAEEDEAKALARDIELCNQFDKDRIYAQWLQTQDFLADAQLLPSTSTPFTVAEPSALVSPIVATTTPPHTPRKSDPPTPVSQTSTPTTPTPPYPTTPTSEYSTPIAPAQTVAVTPPTTPTSPVFATPCSTPSSPVLQTSSPIPFLALVDSETSEDDVPLTRRGKSSKPVYHTSQWDMNRIILANCKQIYPRRFPPPVKYLMGHNKWPLETGILLPVS